MTETSGETPTSDEGDMTTAFAEEVNESTGFVADGGAAALVSNKDCAMI